jgi:hypothetical protein
LTAFTQGWFSRCGLSIFLGGAAGAVRFPQAFVASPLDEAKSGFTARRFDKFTAALPAGASAARQAALNPKALWVRISA